MPELARLLGSLDPDVRGCHVEVIRELLERPFGRELLVTSWTAEIGHGKPHGPALQAMRWIVTKLVDAGHPVWAEFR